MNEDFVPFELAVKLKDKGFKEKCLLHYESTGGFYSNSIDTYDRPNQELDYSDFLKCFNEGNSIGLVDAPTIPQVLKWLREEKKIVISIFPHPCGWQAYIYKDVHCYYESEAERDLVYYHKEKTEISYSYNRLEINCIKYVLDNLI